MATSYHGAGEALRIPSKCAVNRWPSARKRTSWIRYGVYVLVFAFYLLLLIIARLLAPTARQMDRRVADAEPLSPPEWNNSNKSDQVQVPGSDSGKPAGAETSGIVDTGIVQVALAITAVGFAMKSSDISTPVFSEIGPFAFFFGIVTFAQLGAWVFFLGAIASLALSSVYLLEWGTRMYRDYRLRKLSSLHLLVAGIGHGLILLLLVVAILMLAFFA